MIWSNFANSERAGPQKSNKLIALNLVILKPKNESSSVSQSEKLVEYGRQNGKNNF